MSYRQLQQADCTPNEQQWSRAVELDIGQTELMLNNLLPYTKYQVKLYAATSVGRGQVSSAVGITDSAGMYSKN